MLGSAEYFALDIVLLEHFLQLRHDEVDKVAALFQALVDVGGEIFVGFGIEIL